MSPEADSVEDEFYVVLRLVAACAMVADDFD
jgi:hypothetical protein